MGKKTKVGKQRKDKYYNLAKETGFRSRAAFKLIQLNRKFEFLQKSRVCIDLCAAPGGWMQVAKQNMPLSSIILGIDLFPIKPIPGCMSITEDITTEKCRVAIAKELQSWKADVVLHDGAPNVGKNWLHDAYSQACLTLSSLKLATQFLKKGGWFVTKVFRSKDYNPLIWVLKQLFKKVHATKPQASRTESAEIFVVCQHFIAPDKIDPKFMDPKYVFQELEIEPKNKLNVFHPEKKKKEKAEGYPENDYTLHHTLKVSDFIQHENGIDLIQNASEIVFDDEEVLNHKKTTKELLECCKDIKVLGRKDLRSLLNWWKILHEEYEAKNKVDEKADVKEKDVKEEEKQEDSDSELKGIDQQVTELEAEELRDQKRKRKKAQKERKKLNERLNLKMVLKGDDGPRLQADGMFDLKDVKDVDKMDKVLEQTPDIVADSEDENDLPKHKKYLRYDKEEQHLDSSGLYYKDSDSELELESGDESDGDVKEGLGFESDESDKSSSKQKEKKKTKKLKEQKPKKDHPLITDLDYRDKEQKRAHKAEIWFERDVFKNLINEKDEDADLEKMIEEYQKQGAKVIGEDTSDNTKVAKSIKKKKITKKKGVKEHEDSTDSDYSSDETDSSDSDYDVEKELSTPLNKPSKDGFEVVKAGAAPGSRRGKKHKLSEEELALGTVMINSKKSKRDLIDAAWNRYSFGDTNLPDWFVDDENKHMKREAPVPKELVDEYKKKLEEINVRPIKKVIEAKARKKKRALRKLEKAKKKAEALIENGDVTDREKAKQIKAMYRKAHKEPRQELTYVVAKKHSTGKRIKRPTGVKGRYKVVDPRMKKDLRAQKNKLKTMGRGKKGGKAGGAKGKAKAKAKA